MQLDDALVAAADETAVDETEAGEAGTAGAAGGRDGSAGARKRRRGEGEGEDDGAEGADGAVAARLAAGDGDDVRATGDEAGDNDRGAATGSGHRMACTLCRAVLQMCHSLSAPPGAVHPSVTAVQAEPRLFFGKDVCF